MRKTFVPYDERRHPYWPDGAHLAVALNVALEEWDEERMAQTRFVPRYASPPRADAVGIDLSVVSAIEFGFRVGIHRLRDCWQAYGLLPSVFANGLAFERHGDLIGMLVAEQCSFVGHGTDQGLNLAALSAAEQEQVVAAARSAAASAGIALKGWSSPATRESDSLLALLAAEGFEYHVGLHDDELPYWLEAGDRKMLEFGSPNPLAGRPTFAGSWRAEVDARIDFYSACLVAARERPILTALALDPPVDGRPERAIVVGRLLAWLSSQREVWLTNYDEIAGWLRRGIDSRGRR